MRRLPRLLAGWIDDEGGQATVEYILMLSIAMLMVVSVVKKFIQPYLAKLADRMSERIQSSLFSKANMHSLRVGSGH